MAVVISAATQAVSRLPAPAAVVVGLVSLAMVAIPGFWSLLDHFARIAHEGAHAVVGSCLDTKVTGVRLKMRERSGETELQTAAGSGFVVLLVGYLGPSGFGLAAAGLIAHGQIVPVLWIGLALLAMLLPSLRTVFGVALVAGIGFVLLSVVRSRNAEVEAVTAYALSWLLLLSGVRAARERGPISQDAINLRQVTGLPRGLWALLWLVGSVAALVWGSTMLV